MPRVYVRKRETKYTLTDLQKAVKDVEEHKKTYRQAEETYNVPISVIYHRIKGRKVHINKMGAGVSKVLPDKVEGYIASCLKTRAQMGYPVMKEELKNLVKEYVESNGIINKFKDNKPGNDWYTSFMKRHPELTLKKPEHLQKLRVDARKPYIVYDFYDMLKRVVNENNLEEKPMYIFNCDESGFQSDPSKLRAIGHKGKSLQRVSGGSGRETTTVLACVSADGKVLPPVIVFKGAAVQARWTSEESYSGTLYGASKNGWMEEPIFFNWLKKSFIHYVSNLRAEREEPNQKALLLYDGHASHISVRITEEADKANIILMKFPSHLTDKIQPLDKCVFGPVKRAWEKKLIDHGVQQMGKGTGRLTREQFGKLLGEVFTTAFKPENIKSGFNTTGLYPVDPSKFPRSLFNNEDSKLYTVLLNNEKDKNIECTEEDWAENVFQLDLIRFNRESIIETTQNDSQETTTHQMLEGGTKTDSQQKAESIEHIVTEKIVSRKETAIDQTAITEYVIEAVPRNIEIEMTEQDRNIGSEVEIQDKMADQSLEQQIDRKIETVKNSKQKKQEICEKLNTTLSSSLLSNILKQISLDTQTDNNTKTKIVNAILSSVLNEENKVEETISPNKEALEKIFGVNGATPEKKKKIVIPRLKQCAFGEVLTSQEVKERLKEAEAKKQQKKSKTQQKCQNKLKDITNTEKTAKKQRKRKGNERNNKTKTKKVMKVANERKRVDLDDTSNSEIEMSLHSDSDIDEAASDETTSESPFTYHPSKNEQQILEHSDSGKTSVSPVAGCSKPDDDITVYPEYEESDTVLVRYISKKKVEYFVGRIINKMENDLYKLLFFKTVGKNDNTRFLMTKKDTDIVPVGMIVKTVNLLSINSKETEFVFLDDDDYVYFD